MKTLEDLKALREKLKADMKVRQNDGTKIIIGMGTSASTLLFFISHPPLHHFIFPTFTLSTQGFLLLMQVYHI